jgi:hypothetical protein
MNLLVDIFDECPWIIVHSPFIFKQGVTKSVVLCESTYQEDEEEEEKEDQRDHNNASSPETAREMSSPRSHYDYETNKNDKNHESNHLAPVREEAEEEGEGLLTQRSAIEDVVAGNATTTLGDDRNDIDGELDEESAKWMSHPDDDKPKHFRSRKRSIPMHLPEIIITRRHLTVKIIEKEVRNSQYLIITL